MIAALYVVYFVNKFKMMLKEKKHYTFLGYFFLYFKNFFINESNFFSLSVI